MVCSEYKLNINFKKGEFLMRKFEFSGYVVEDESIQPLTS